MNLTSAHDGNFGRHGTKERSFLLLFLTSGTPPLEARLRGDSVDILPW